MNQCSRKYETDFVSTECKRQARMLSQDDTVMPFSIWDKKTALAFQIPSHYTIRGRDGRAMIHGIGVNCNRNAEKEAQCLPGDRQDLSWLTEH